MIKKVDLDFYKFKLSFKGQLVENSVDAYDVANTILATSAILEEISKIRYGDDTTLKININAFQKGSLSTEFLLLLDHAKDMTGALMPMSGSILEIGKQILDSYRTYIDIKKFLKGKSPKETRVIEGNNIQMTSQDNSTMIINYYDLRIVQNSSIARNAAKAVQPLTKSDSLLEEIDMISQDKEIEIEISKEAAPYIATDDNVQNLPSVKYKGIISKIDTKTRSGYIDIGNKRLTFTYSKNLPHEQFIMLVESLKQKIQIYLVGNVTMDFESNPKSMLVANVESDIKLF